MSKMRRLKTAMLAFATGEILTAATSGLAQSPTAGPSAAAPVTLSSSGPATTDTANTMGSKTGAEASGPDGAKPESNSGGAEAGYTWRDKHKGKHRKLHSTKVNPDLTQAKGPEFAIVPDGSSRITVQLSRKVDVVAQGNRRRFTYDLPNVQVAVANDMNPLITTHFSTPLQNARLIPQKKGARLVVDLRESVTPAYSIRNGSGGGAILEVVLPKSLAKTSTPADPQPKKTRTKSRATGKSRKSRNNAAAPQSGIGPRL